MAEQLPSPQLRSLVEEAQQAIAAAAARKTLPLPYAAPDRRPNPAVETSDRIRAGAFGFAAALLLACALLFGGGFHGRVLDNPLDTGAFAGFAWPAVGVALLASAVFSALPHQLSSRRQRAATPWALLAAALYSCAMALSAGFLPLPAALVATAASVLALAGVSRLNAQTARNQLERWGTDAPLSLMAGLGLVFSLQLWCAAAGWNFTENRAAVLIGAGIMALAAAVFAHSERGRHALATGFGLALLAAGIHGWLAASLPLWGSATWAGLALLVVLCAENRRYQITHAEHRLQRGEELDF